MSGRFVAARTITLVPVSKPSISTRIWFNVCSRSSWPPPSPAPRCRPTASISSTNTMHGELRLAWSNRSRTRLAPTPTNISTNSEPDMAKKGTPASPDTALAIRVLPVPGGPTSRTPLGILAPNARNRSGNLRNSTTSRSSSLASSTPATSSKLTVGPLPVATLARLRPKLNVWLELPCACRIMNNSMAPKKIKGRKLNKIPKRLESPLEPLTTISIFVVRGSTPARSKSSTTLASASLREVSASPLTVRISSSLPRISITAKSPRAANDTTSLIEISCEPPTESENSVNTMAVIATIISR